MEHSDKKEILDAIGSLVEQTRELKQGRTEILDAIGSLAEQTSDLKQGRTEILDAIGSLTEQTQELKEGRTEILEAIGSLTEDTRELKEGRIEILEAIHSFATSVDERFDRADRRMTRIETTMVTKDYLDDKLADFHSDIVNFVKRRVPSWTEAGL